MNKNRGGKISVRNKPTKIRAGTLKSRLLMLIACYYKASNCDFALLCGWAAVVIAGFNLSDCIIIDVENPEKQERADSLKELVREHLSSLSTHSGV